MAHPPAGRSGAQPRARGAAARKTRLSAADPSFDELPPAELLQTPSRTTADPVLLRWRELPSADDSAPARSPRTRTAAASTSPTRKSTAAATQTALSFPEPVAAGKTRKTAAATSRAKSVTSAAPKPKAPRTTRKKAKQGFIPTETSLLWGLLYDLVKTPRWLWRETLGKARPSDRPQPLERLLRFTLSARMTVVLICLNLLVFVIEAIAQQLGLKDAAFYAHFALSQDGLIRGEYLPLLTHVFAHGSLMHLAGNMLALFVFGRVVERHLGPWRLLACFILAAVVSTSLSLLAQGLGGRSVPTLGASGAVAGLLALGILLEPLTLTFEALLPLPLFLVGWLAIGTDFLAMWRGSSAASHISPIDHPAHLGGYLSVLLAYSLLSRRTQLRARAGLWINILTLLLMAVAWWAIGERSTP